MIVAPFQSFLLSARARKSRVVKYSLPDIDPAPRETTGVVNCSAQLVAPLLESTGSTAEHDFEELADNERVRLESSMEHRACFRLRTTNEVWHAVPLELLWSPDTIHHRQTYSHPARSLSPLYGPPRVTTSMPDLPQFIKPVPSSLGADEIEYLQKKGAFTLPDPALRDECLRCYRLYMHPLFPSVDYPQVWSVVHAEHSTSNGRLSLLLLQAIMFAGAMWVEVGLVRRARFLSRKAFRHSLHQKIRALYDADYEEDRLTLVQSLLLWSFWFKGANEQKDGWHWVGVAHSIARSIDLHLPTYSGSNPARQRLRKQLWWALQNREVIGSLDLGRAPRLRHTDHIVPMLQLDDFEYEERVSDTLSDIPYPPTATQRRNLTRITIEFVRLNQIFNQILGVVSPENNARQTAVLRSAQQMEGFNHLASTKRYVNLDSIGTCERDLRRWREEVPKELWHAAPLPLNPYDWVKAELSHRAMLCMIYHMAVMTIHRAQLLPLDPAESSYSELSEYNRKHVSRMLVRHAAREITSTAMDFFNADLVAALPATVVSCLMPVSIRHTLDTFADDVTVQTEAFRQLDECRAMLYVLAERQFAPGWVLQILERILGRARHHESSENAARSRQQVSGLAEHPAEYEDPGQREYGADELEKPASTTHDVPTVLGAPQANTPTGTTDIASFLEQNVLSAFTNPNLGQTEWPSIMDIPEGWSDPQLAFLGTAPFPAGSGSLGGLEEPWQDFARGSIALTGLDYH